MPGSKHWGDPDEDEYMDDNGQVLYFDKSGRLRKQRKTDREYQQMYHYYEEDN